MYLLLCVASPAGPAPCSAEASDVDFDSDLVITRDDAGDPDSMLAALEDSLLLRPGDRDLLFEKAGLLFYMDRFAEAEQAYQVLLDANPDDQELRVALTSLYLAAGDADAAREHADMAVALQTDSAGLYEILSLRMFAAMMQGDADRAEEDCALQIEMCPDSLLPYGNMTSILMTAGRMSEAAWYAREGVRVAPDSGSAHLSLARIYNYSGMPEDALESYSHAIMADPLLLDAYLERASLHLSEELFDPELALADMEAAVGLAPDDPEVLARRAQALWYCGEDDSALAALDRAMELDTTCVHAYTMAAEIRQWRREPDHVEELLLDVVEMGNATEEVYCSLVMSAAGTGHPEIAAEHAREAIEDLGYDDTMLHLILGGCCLELGRYEEAHESLLAGYERLRAGDSGYVTSWDPDSLGLVIADLETFVGLPEGSAGYHFNRGIYLGDRGLYREAVDDLTTALENAPDMCEAYFHRALCLKELGDHAGAADDLEDFLDSGPESSWQERLARQMLEDLE